MGLLISFIVILALAILIGNGLAYKYKKKKYTIMAVTVGVGSFVEGLIILGYDGKISPLVTIVGSLIGGLVMTFSFMGFMSMRNDVATKIGFMKESERKVEEEQLDKELFAMLGLNKKKKQD